MSSREVTDQEKFWQGEFGTEYTNRKGAQDHQALAAQALALEIRDVQRPIRSVLELGANRGLNINALKYLLPSAKFAGVEINRDAAKILKLTGATVFQQSILDFESEEKYDFVLIRGVLIHLNPTVLNLAYKVIAECSSRYVLISEYYNPVPIAIEYRGEKERLFKRDFAGEFMDQHKEFRIRDYGFHYHKGHYPGDDQTWFLMERNQ